MLSLFPPGCHVEWSSPAYVAALRVAARRGPYAVCFCAMAFSRSLRRHAVMDMSPTRSSGGGCAAAQASYSSAHMKLVGRGTLLYRLPSGRTFHIQNERALKAARVPLGLTPAVELPELRRRRKAVHWVFPVVAAGRAPPPPPFLSSRLRFERRGGGEPSSSPTAPEWYPTRKARRRRASFFRSHRARMVCRLERQGVKHEWRRELQSRARRRTYLEVARRESALDPLDRRARGPAAVGCAEQRADVALACAPRRPCEVYV